MGHKEKLNELQEKISDIFEGIDGYYSQSILDELVDRIENTINDFNNDFKDLVGKLNKPTAKSKSGKRASTASKKT